MTRLMTREHTTAPLASYVVELRGVGVGARSSARHQRSDIPAVSLSPVDLVVRHGELVILTGQSRAARSTLLNVIGLLIRPTTGSYLLHGQDTAALGDRDRSALRGRDIGLVLQPPHLLPARSVLENVMLPLIYAGLGRRSRRSLALDSLERVGLGARADVLASDLPADERQRAGIARALVTTPSLLLCDEPTAGLDPGQATRVLGLLADLRAAGRTVLVSSSSLLPPDLGARHLRMGTGPASGLGWQAGGDKHDLAR